MRITLDHNCLIDVANNSEVGQCVLEIVRSEFTECFVVNVGASEMIDRGVVPNDYGTFSDFLESIGLAHLKRLNPVGVFNVTFYGHCIFGSEESRTLTIGIEKILFPSPLVVKPENTNYGIIMERKSRNRMCDVHSLWCHINNQNDLFMTSDKNFRKKTKLPLLLDLGVNSIISPCDESLRESLAKLRK